MSSSAPVISVRGVGKHYQLGATVSNDMLREDLMRVFRFLLRRNQERREKNEIWALKDVSFDVHQGEVVGIIGRNGAGKSTLLKILTRITDPTEGEVRLRGRVASLLEVGTGFHPELTGRENIFLNGAILGMTRAEIKSKFDEIVDFSGVEKFIDTPVKRYSSGMYVRLAFAVAAHLEPEILLVDEVLAVGDIEFQRKCLGKMGEVARGGRTVLFVSHNMAAVRRLCSTAFLLNKGQIELDGPTSKVVEVYLKGNSSTETHISLPDEPGEPVSLTEFEIMVKEGTQINIESGFQVRARLSNRKENTDLAVSILVSTLDGDLLFESPCFISTDGDSRAGVYEIVGAVPPHLLNSGRYTVGLLVGERQKYVLLNKPQLLTFEIHNTLLNSGENLNRLPGLLRPMVSWDWKFLGGS